MSQSVSPPAHLNALQRQWRASNPVFLVRKQMNLSRALFALWLGVDASTVRAVEQGHFARLPARMVAALEAVGLDALDLGLRYLAWRQGFRAALQATLRPPSRGPNRPPAQASPAPSTRSHASANPCLPASVRAGTGGKRR